MTGAVVEQLTFQDRAKVVSDQVLGRSKTAGYGTPATQPGRPGVDVMITIFCDFCQFSEKN
jgi:hypothetical protein